MIRTILIYFLDGLAYFSILFGLVVLGFAILVVINRHTHNVGVLFLVAAGLLVVGLLIKSFTGKRTGQSFWDHLVNDLLLSLFNH